MLLVRDFVKKYDARKMPQKKPEAPVKPHKKPESKPAPQRKAPQKKSAPEKPAGPVSKKNKPEKPAEPVHKKNKPEKPVKPERKKVKPGKPVKAPTEKAEEPKDSEPKQNKSPLLSKIIVGILIALLGAGAIAITAINNHEDISKLLSIIRGETQAVETSATENEYKIAASLAVQTSGTASETETTTPAPTPTPIVIKRRCSGSYRSCHSHRSRSSG